jgi:hypothetical protein
MTADEGVPATGVTASGITGAPGPGSRGTAAGVATIPDRRGTAVRASRPAWPALPAHLADAVADEAALRRFLHGLPGVDPVGVEARAAALATRSIKKASKLAAIDLAISMVDLTTLEGADTPGKVRSLCAKARRPDPDRPDTPAGRRRLRVPRHGRARRAGTDRDRGRHRGRSPPRSRPAAHRSR